MRTILFETSFCMFGKHSCSKYNYLKLDPYLSNEENIFLDSPSRSYFVCELFFYIKSIWKINAKQNKKPQAIFNVVKLVELNFVDVAFITVIFI